VIKHLLFFFLLWTNTLACFSQAPSFQLTQTIGTPVGDPTDVVVDQDGFIYLLDRPGVTKLAPNGSFVQRLPLQSSSSAYLGLGVDKAHNYYVCNYSDSRIEKYSPSGKLVRQFGTYGSSLGQFRYAKGLAVDTIGNIYVADAENNRLQKFDTDGNLLFVYSGTGSTKLHEPSDVTLDASGNVYVYGKDFNVTKLSATGVLIQTISLAAASQASYDEGTTMALDAQGNFYIKSFNGNAIFKFTSTGVYVSTIGAGLFYSTQTPLAVDAAGTLYATSTGKLRKFKLDGQLAFTWGNFAKLGPGVLDAANNYYCFDAELGSISKFDAAGQLIAQFDKALLSGALTALALDPLGNLYALTIGYSETSITKLGPDGRSIARFTTLGSTMTYTGHGGGIAVDAEGTMYVSDVYGGCVRKVSAQGKLLPPIGTQGTGLGQLYHPLGVGIDARGYLYVADNEGARVQRFTPAGKLISEWGTRPAANSSLASGTTLSMTVDATGNTYLRGHLDGIQLYEAQNGKMTTLSKVNSGLLAVNPSGSRLVSLAGDVIRLYTSEQVRPQNVLTGTIFQDLNGNCTREPTELALPNITLVAQPGNYYGLSDENGRYTIAVDSGTYTVQQLLPPYEVARAITPLCVTAAKLHFPAYGAVASGPDFGNQVRAAPYLSVQVGTNRRRRCFRSSTTITYTNTGFATASNAQVKVALSPYVAFISATVPHTQDEQGNLVFQVGTLAPNEQGTILLQDSVVCGDPTLRGLTVCTKVWITPLNVYPPLPTGNIPSMTVQGSVLATNQARFVVRNATAVNMRDSLGLRIYQNSALALQQHYLLAAGDSLVLRIPATRPVVRVEADQPPGHLTQRTASSTVELRALSVVGQVNPDMLALPPNRPGPETAEDCQPILDSFDPNDKQVVPLGTTAQHYTPTGVPLRYQVRFQNTGTDDAYYVSVVDTLAADLDLRTLRVTTASHPYWLTVTGHGRPVLTFTFTNINLPPSSRNEAGSNGFVQFSIQPKAGLPARALIENKADIFFDYNPPIRTNVTANRLYDEPLLVEPAVALPYVAVQVSPTLLHFTPIQGKPGALVTLSGQHFAATAAANTVRFNGIAAPVLIATATTLTVRVPATATTGTIEVITAEGAGRGRQNFTVYQPPTLTVMTPAEGVPGSVVTLTGTHFAPIGAQDTVWFNNVPALVQEVTVNRLQVQVPAGALSGKVRISTLGGQVVSSQDFVVWSPPTLTSFTPSRGKVGDLITLTGRNFAPLGRTEVRLGSGEAVVQQAASTSLQVLVAVSAQTGPIQVRTPGGTTISTASFMFLPAPTISSFTPAQGSIGDTVVLTGKNFLVDGQPDTVYVGGKQAPVLGSTATTTTIRVPKGAFSGPLTIAGTGGQSQTTTAFRLLPLLATEAITVYPNPAHGVVTLDWLRADFSLEQVQVYNALGKLVSKLYVRDHAASSLSLPLPTGQTGLYLLVIQTSQGSVLKRVTLY
jgi:sugar lactone lactonase YvrE